MASPIEVVHSGQREGSFYLYCISQIEGGQYIGFRLRVQDGDLVEPFAMPNREEAIKQIEEFFLLDSEPEAER